MKTFICQACSYISFDEAPVLCPVCNAAIENFESNDNVIHTAADPDNLNETEKKHIPVITLTTECGLAHQQCRVAQVSVGEVAHVMESEHFIRYMDFYINKKFRSRVVLTHKGNYPASSLHMNMDCGTLSVIAYCNVHGPWRAKVKLAEE